MPKRLNLNELINIFNLKHKYKYDYSKSIYTGINHKIEIICPIHGSFYQTAGGHKLYGCHLCGRVAQQNFYESRKKIFNVIEIASYINSRGTQYHVDLNCEYYKSSDILNIHCDIHDEYTEYTINNIFRNVNFCNKCKICLRSLQQHRPKYKNRLTFEKYLSRLDEVFPKSFYSVKRIQNGIFSMDEIIEITCKRHNVIFNRVARNVLNNRCACFKCNKSISIPEMIIYKTLIDCNYEFEFQKVFDELKIGYNKYLRVDFFIPSMNLIIEYDGEQHFRPLSRGRNLTETELTSKFLKTQDNDERKTEFALNNNINLERISFTIKNNNLKEHLLNLLSKYE